MRNAIAAIVSSVLIATALAPAAAPAAPAPQWQGGLAPHSEVWWTGSCYMRPPIVHVHDGARMIRIRGRFNAAGDLFVYRFGGRRVVFDGVNLTNNLQTDITFTASC